MDMSLGRNFAGRRSHLSFPALSSKKLVLVQGCSMESNTLWNNQLACQFCNGPSEWISGPESGNGELESSGDARPG